MKKCKNCKRFKPISYAGGDNIYAYCNQEYIYKPCSGGECDYPDMYEQIKNKVMKANEVPEKLYIDTEDRLSDSILYGFIEKRKDDDIEYVRTDAFIKKACETFCKMRCNDKPPRSTCTSLGTCFEHDEFRKALKGE